MMARVDLTDRSSSPFTVVGGAAYLHAQAQAQAARSLASPVLNAPPFEFDADAAYRAMLLRPATAAASSAAGGSGVTAMHVDAQSDNRQTKKLKQHETDDAASNPTSIAASVAAAAANAAATAALASAMNTQHQHQLHQQHQQHQQQQSAHPPHAAPASARSLSAAAKK